MVKQKKWNVKHILHSLGWHFCHIRLLMHPRPLWFPFDVQHTIVLFKCTHTQTHTLRITSAGEDYEYYWNKNTHFVWQRVPLCARGCAWLSSTNLLFLVFFLCKRLLERLCIQTTGVSGGGGLMGLWHCPLGIRFPQYTTCINLKTHTPALQSPLPPPRSPAAASADCAHIVTLTLIHMNFQTGFRVTASQGRKPTLW